MLSGIAFAPATVPESVGEASVGPVASTTLPEPVVVAALIAVPLPCRMPEIDVLSVMLGVVVGVATVPDRPLALATLTLVTVPDVRDIELHVA